ncbi:MAG: DUF3047 domain-containing protein [Candidatus Omnitrophota bacterium]
MKRLIKLILTLMLIVFTGISLYVVYFSSIKKKPLVEFGKKEVLAHFEFLSREELEKWEEKSFVQNKTSYRVMSYGARKCVKAMSENSASALFLKERLFSDKNPFISWEWKVERFPSLKRKEALDKKAEFDFSAQVYVVFFSRFFLKTKAIQYVWAKEVPVGTVVSSPYTNNVKILVLASGESDEWRKEERDINKDFKELFSSEEDKDVMGIAFMTDSDSTGSNAVAYYDEIEFGYETKVSLRRLASNT